jgi:hypothetical protein
MKNILTCMAIGQTGFNRTVPVWHLVMNSTINETYVYGNYPEKVHHIILIKFT